MSLTPLIEREESYSGGALQRNSTGRWNRNQSPRINLPTFPDTQNTIVTIRTSYQNIDDLTFFLPEVNPNISPLSLRIELNNESYQKVYRLLKCILILSKLSQQALEEASRTLESIQQIEEECYYQESESPEIINSFLSVAKAMPVANNQYDSIYSDEELDSF